MYFHIILAAAFLFVVSGEADIPADMHSSTAAGGETESESSGLDSEKSEESVPSTGEASGSQVNLSPFEKYKRLFNEHRSRQLEAVKSILNFGDEKQRYELINVMLKQLFKTIEQAKVNLTMSGFLPGDPFPENDTVRDYVSKVLENTAMFGDMVLRLPDLVHDLYDRQREWQLLLAWSYGFCTQSGAFEGPNEQLLHLMAQEVGIIAMDPNYVNPFKAANQKKKRYEEPAKPAKKKQKKIRRGPRLSHSEL
ncbi:coiled-coil domain-containing protein 134 [Aplysia californica]|uniref:Coiled-coil domain-containing protein 134 n=1 Tax=Aplysia californica TaxID=6500 RepID=A0ABM0JN45_APLCA|nr:coiled-coil domain-containing protein 134 [Aplysia californica]